MIFTIAEIVSYISQVMTLEPGNLITTGTPEGVILAVCRRTPFCSRGILTSPLGNAVRNRGYSDFSDRLPGTAERNWLQDGEETVVEVERLGRLRNTFSRVSERPFIPQRP
jgi:2-keto-4-pentenoate hydratase/2-oxohepta-3-ene-1,7-dioic acid hydratase in catechol pathway